MIYEVFNMNSKYYRQMMDVIVAAKVNPPKKGQTRSEFGMKFKEHYGITKSQNNKLYNTELLWYRRHNNKCRWE